jgi:hypothetical protein
VSAANIYLQVEFVRPAWRARQIGRAARAGREAGRSVVAVGATPPLRAREQNSTPHRRRLSGDCVIDINDKRLGTEKAPQLASSNRLDIMTLWQFSVSGIAPR